MKKKDINPILVLFFLALGVGIFGIITSFMFLYIGSIAIGYISLVILSLVSGALSYSIIKKQTKKDKIRLLAGIVSPVVAVLILFFLFSFSTEGLKVLRAEDGISKDNKINNVDVTSVVTGTPNPYISSVLFFTLFNIPFLIGFFKKKEKKIRYLAWYLLAPILFFLVWLVSNLLVEWLIDVIRGYV